MNESLRSTADGRHLASAPIAQAQWRQQRIRLAREILNGTTPMDLAKQEGLTRNQIYQKIQQACRAAIEIPKSKANPPGSIPFSLSAIQENPKFWLRRLNLLEKTWGLKPTPSASARSRLCANESRDAWTIAGLPKPGASRGLPSVMESPWSTFSADGRHLARAPGAQAQWRKQRIRMAREILNGANTLGLANQEGISTTRLHALVKEAILAALKIPKPKAIPPGDPFSLNSIRAHPNFWLRRLELLEKAWGL